jgi:hypothetical protein
MISEEKLRVATILLFVKAFVMEMDSRDIRIKPAQKLLKQINKFIRTVNNPKDKEILGKVSNVAWDRVCDTGEMVDVYVTAIISYLLHSKYEDLIVDMSGISLKVVDTLFEMSRSSIPIRHRISNRDLANTCIKDINREIYLNT